MAVSSIWGLPVFAFMLLICTNSFAQTDTINIKNGKITSTGYWIPKNIKEVKGLKEGPFVQLSNGDILTVDNDKSCISHDGAKTWIEYPIFTDTAKFKMGPAKAIICTRNGIIILAFVNLKERANWNWRNDIHDSPDATLPTYAVRSLDGGKSWQDVQKLHDEWTGSIRDIIQTRDGSVIFTSMMFRHHPGHHTVVTYTSKDEGKRWIRSNIIDLGGVGNHSGVMESTLIQKKDGNLWMLMRTNWGHFWSAISENDGLIWKDFQVTDIDASSANGMLKRLQSNRIVLVWNRMYLQGHESGPLRGGDGNLTEVATSWQREELSMIISSDDGKTWSEPVVIAKAIEKGKQVSYPSILEVKPGELWITTRFRGNLRIHYLKRIFFNRLLTETYSI